MGTKYLLPCPKCGEELPVESSQAGMQMQCFCGAELEVPTLLALKSLEPLEEKKPPVEKAGWGPAQGLFFLGVVLLMSGFGFALALWLSIPAYLPEEIDEQFVLRRFQEQTLTESWDHWEQVESLTLRHVPTPELAQWRRLRDTRLRWTYVSATVGCVGLALLLAAAVFRWKQRRSG